MSWPTDGEPRYVTVVTHGFTIKNPPTTPATTRRDQATYAVLERAYCHTEVAAWRSEVYDRVRSKLTAQTRAEARCAELNAEHDADLTLRLARARTPSARLHAQTGPDTATTSPAA